jgi:hypothetical protein
MPLRFIAKKGILTPAFCSQLPKNGEAIPETIMEQYDEEFGVLWTPLFPCIKDLRLTRDCLENMVLKR